MKTTAAAGAKLDINFGAAGLLDARIAGHRSQEAVDARRKPISEDAAGEKTSTRSRERHRPALYNLVEPAEANTTCSNSCPSGVQGLCFTFG